MSSDIDLARAPMISRDATLSALFGYWRKFYGIIYDYEQSAVFCNNSN